MPRKDIYHDAVRVALEKDEWTITDDPLLIVWEGATYFPDLGAERVIAATKGIEKIAVEIKTLEKQISQDDFYGVLGQYDSYYIALSETEPERELILAVPKKLYETFFQKKHVQRIVIWKHISLLVYDPQNETIEKWIK
jgi:hypothetical protein